MVEVAGVELLNRSKSTSCDSNTCKYDTPQHTQIDPQSGVAACPKLRKIVDTWSHLPNNIKDAMTALIAPYDKQNRA